MLPTETEFNGKLEGRGYFEAIHHTFFPREVNNSREFALFKLGHFYAAGIVFFGIFLCCRLSPLHNYSELRYPAGLGIAYSGREQGVNVQPGYGVARGDLINDFALIHFCTAPKIGVEKTHGDGVCCEGRRPAEGGRGVRNGLPCPPRRAQATRRLAARRVGRGIAVGAEDTPQAPPGPPTPGVPPAGRRGHQPEMPGRLRGR